MFHWGASRDRHGILRHAFSDTLRCETSTGHTHLVSIWHHGLRSLRAKPRQRRQLRLAVHWNTVRARVWGRVGDGGVVVSGRRCTRRRERAGVLVVAAVVIHGIQVSGAAAGERASLRCALQPPMLLNDPSEGAFPTLVVREAFSCARIYARAWRTAYLGRGSTSYHGVPNVFASCFAQPRHRLVRNLND